MRLLLLCLLALCAPLARGQDVPEVRIAALKYEGGGDWYQAQTPLPAFLAYVRANTLIPVSAQAEVVDLSSDRLFTFPLLVLSGHGNVRFAAEEVLRLRRYLESGGFLLIDDDYGLDPYVRREMEKVFPDQAFVEIPHDHPLYSAHFSFPDGPPKIHEHDGKPPQGFGLFHNGRLCVYYLYESNISDGWEPPDVHGNPPQVREAALRMGVNVLTFALMN